MTKRFWVLFGLLAAAGAAHAEPLGEGDVEAGQNKSTACAACHGPQGNMESDQFPKLAGQHATYTYEQLMLFKSGERQNAIMAGQVAGLSEQDMKDLAAYYAAQQTRPGVTDERLATRGAELYHAGSVDGRVPACSGCHGPAGIGNAGAKYPRLSGQSPQYVVSQLEAYRSGERAGYRNATIMNGVAEDLSDEDINALASYVAGLQPATGDQAREHGALMQGVSAEAARRQASEQSDDQASSEEAAAQPQDGEADMAESGESSSGAAGAAQAGGAGAAAAALAQDAAQPGDQSSGGSGQSDGEQAGQSASGQAGQNGSGQSGQAPSGPSNPNGQTSGSSANSNLPNDDPDRSSPQSLPEAAQEDVGQAASPDSDDEAQQAAEAMGEDDSILPDLSQPNAASQPGESEAGADAADPPDPQGAGSTDSDGGGNP